MDSSGLLVRERRGSTILTCLPEAIKGPLRRKSWSYKDKYSLNDLEKYFSKFGDIKEEDKVRTSFGLFSFF